VTHKMPILTIAVPTYNRLDCLRLLVDSIRPELQASEGAIELLVCDNASADGTAAWLRELAAQGVLRLIEQPANIGADGNILTCMREAGSRHVWVCSDDDLPDAGVLTRVASFLRDHPAHLLYLPSRWHHGDLAQLPRGQASAAQPHALSTRALALQARHYVVFISSWVMDRDAYLALAGGDHSERYSGTSLLQLEWVLTLLAGGGPVYSVRDAWVLARGGNSGGYSLFDTFVTHYPRILREKLDGVPAVRDFLVGQLLHDHLTGMVWALRKGVIGNFASLDWQRLDRMLVATWPHDLRGRRWLRRIACWPPAVAYLAMGYCWFKARAWRAWLRASGWTAAR
jgi:abequosyltransferase